jgi:SAM-dependent methyltransferase
VAAPTSTNAQQIHYWNAVAGPRWRARRPLLDEQLRPLGREAMDRARVAPGERVLDVGCGCGDSTLDLARRVGAEGEVVGIDISRVLLEEARARAEHEDLGGVAFRPDDAQVADLGEGRFELVYSRFGVMFFDDPVAAFANLYRSLRASGRLVFVCWQPVERNPWMGAPVAAAARHVTLPPRPDPHGPGPFAFADPERVRKILVAAGFDEVETADWSGTLSLGGGTLEGAVDLFFDVGPLAALLREQGAGPELRQQVADAVTEALAPFLTEDGVRMPAAAWIVSARR